MSPIKEREHRKRVEIYNKTGGRCYFCGRELEINPLYPTDNEMTIDHLIPRSKGGSNKYANKVPACKYCNNLKSNRMITDKLSYKIFISYAYEETLVF